MTGNNKTLSPNTTSIAAKAASAAIISVTGLAWAQSLLSSGRVNQATFLCLVGIIALVGLFIAFSHRIKLLNLRQLTLELERVEEARKEVEAREQRIRRTALALSEVTMFMTGLHMRCADDKERALEARWISRKVGELLDMVSASTAERASTFRFHEALERMDALREKDPETAAAQWDSIWKGLREELDKKPTTVS